MKKFLSLLLTIAIIAQMLVVPVFAEESAAADTTPVVPAAEDTSPVTPEVEVEKETTTASFTAENLSGNPAGTTVDVTHVPAESVSVSEDTLSLDLAGTTTAALSASILPEDTTDIITWSSDNGAVATVDENGNVTAVSVGTANITASTVSSQDGGSTVSAICAVTVTCSHNMEHCLCTLCGYSDPASVDYVASVASPFEAPFYFATLKEAVEFAHTIPLEERPFVAVEKDCTIDETITISDGINIFSSVQGENRKITVTADTAFELTDRAFLLINYLDIDTTGSYIFKLTSNGNGVQMSDTNLSGATDSAFYVPEGVERNGIQFYGGSISAHTAITMNGNQGGFTIAGDGVAIDVSNPEGAFVLNGSNYEGQVFGVTLTNSAENGVAFSLSNTSSFRNGGMTFNGINDYWNPHYNQPSGKIMPNKGAAARVDITYYGNVQAAVKAASELPTTDEEGNVIEGTIAITIIGNLPAAETLTLDAKRPIDLYATGNSPQILLETGAVLNVNQTTKLHNATIYVCNGAAINGLEHIDLTDGGKIVYESDFDAIETNVAKAVLPNGTCEYFTSLKAAVEFVHGTPRDERSAVFVLRDCTIDETITISDGINIFSSVQGENRSITVTADTAFELTGKAFLLINDLDIDTTGSYIFKLTSNGNGVQMSDTNLSGATDSAFYVPEGVERNGIQFYGGSISAHTAITMNGNQGGFTIAGDGAAIDVSNPEGAFVLNGSNYEGQMYDVSVTNTAENGVAFSLSSTSSIALNGVMFNGKNIYWNPHYNQPEGQIMPNNGAVARVDTAYYGNLHSALSAASETLYTNEDGSVIEVASVPVTIIGNLSTAETLTLAANHPIELHATGDSPQILLENGAVLNVNQTTKLHNATIYVCNGAAINGLEHIDLTDGGKIVYEEITRDPVAQIGNTTYASIEEALAAAKAGDTVTLLADAETSVLMLASGITLNLGDYDLTAEYVLAFKESTILANPNSGKLIVPEGNLILGEGAQNAAGQYILPVWDPENENYVFSLFVANTKTDARGLYIEETNGTIEFQWKHQATGVINSSLLGDNGGADNGVSMIVRLEWSNADGVAYQNFVFNESFVQKVASLTGANAKDYKLALTGFNALEVNLDTLVVYAMIATESGAAAYGEQWTLENAR